MFFIGVVLENFEKTNIHNWKIWEDYTLQKNSTNGPKCALPAHAVPLFTLRSSHRNPDKNVISVIIRSRAIIGPF